MGKIIVKPQQGKVVINFESTPLGDKYVDIIYRSRKRFFNKYLFKTTRRRVKLPEGVYYSLIQNNKPTVGAVTINYRKK